MDKEKKRKFHLVLYGIAIPVSLFGGRKIFCVYGKNSSLIRNRYV